MGRFIVRRVLETIPVLIITSFHDLRHPADRPGRTRRQVCAKPQDHAGRRSRPSEKRWGLDQPIPIQYCRWLGVCNPDGEGLGRPHQQSGLCPTSCPSSSAAATTASCTATSASRSSTAGRSPRDRRAVVPTIILAGDRPGSSGSSSRSSTGVIAAVKTVRLLRPAADGLRLHRLLVADVLAGPDADPDVFAAPLKILPAGRACGTRARPDLRHGPTTGSCFGRTTASTPLVDLGRHLILPVFTLVAVSVAGDSRFVRAAMIDALNQDYVRTARAKGVAGADGHLEARPPQRAAADHHQPGSRDPVPLHGRDRRPRRSSAGRAWAAASSRPRMRSTTRS